MTTDQEVVGSNPTGFTDEWKVRFTPQAGTDFLFYSKSKLVCIYVRK